MNQMHQVDVYKVQVLASSLVNHRLTSAEFQREYHLLTDPERKALHVRVGELSSRRAQLSLD